MQNNRVFAVSSKLDFHFTENGQVSDCSAQRFQGSLLGREAGGVPQCRFLARAAMPDLFPAKYAVLSQPFAPRQFLLDTTVLDEVNPQTDDHNDAPSQRTTSTLQCRETSLEWVSFEARGLTNGGRTDRAVPEQDWGSTPGRVLLGILRGRCAADNIPNLYEAG